MGALFIVEGKAMAEDAIVTEEVVDNTTWLIPNEVNMKEWNVVHETWTLPPVIDEYNYVYQ